jgi:kynurenine 3-monooxygenase
MSARKVTIVGGGPGGLLMAVFLARRGCAVNVYEASPDLRREAVAGGRSINLTLATRGIDALDRVGLAGTVLDKLCTVLHSRVVHDRTGAWHEVPYGVRSHEVLNAVSRTELTKFLLDAAAGEPGVRLHFRHRCVGLDKTTATVRLADQVNGREIEVPADLVIGADGVYSAVRREMHRGELVDFSQNFVPWRYKELTIDADQGGRYGLDMNALHIWPRGDFMMFALPNRDKSFNAICVLPVHGPTGFDSLRSPAKVRLFFDTNFPGVVRLMPHLVEEFLDRPPSGFPTIRTSSWHYQDKVVLIGDACHAVVPFYGQGMNAAFEDCVVLDQYLAQHWRNWGPALREYEHARRVHTDALADLSLANFTELRDTSGRPALAARKKVSRLTYRLLGERAAPLYSLVSHSTIPYADCVRVARVRERVSRLFGADLAVAAFVAHGLVRSRVKPAAALPAYYEEPDEHPAEQPTPIRRPA